MEFCEISSIKFMILRKREVNLDLIILMTYWKKKTKSKTAILKDCTDNVEISFDNQTQVIPEIKVHNEETNKDGNVDKLDNAVN